MPVQQAAPVVTTAGADAALLPAIIYTGPMGDRRRSGTAFIVGLALASAGICGCHARWNPLATPARRDQGRTIEGKLNQPMRGLLSEEGAGYAVGFKYDILAPGKLSISAAPDVASVALDLLVFHDAGTPIATTRVAADKRLDVQVVLGTYFVVVSEPGKEAVNTWFTLTAGFTPDVAASGGGPEQPAAP